MEDVGHGQNEREDAWGGGGEVHLFAVQTSFFWFHRSIASIDEMSNACDLLGPLPKTKRGNTHILLSVDLFSTSRHAESYATPGEEKTAEGCASVSANDYIPPRWGCPHTFLSDRGTEFTSAVCRAVLKMLGPVKRFIPSTNKWHERKTEPHALSNVGISSGGRPKKLG